jgi:hypothetical protein
MFEKLRKKWNVNLPQLILILCVFAIGGSFTGYIGKILMPLLGISNSILWTVVYLFLVTIIWPVMVLIVSIPFGQFPFFRHYISRLLGRLKINR